MIDNAYNTWRFEAKAGKEWTMTPIKTNAVELDRDWKIQGFDGRENIPEAVHGTSFDDTEWLAAAVPGDVHSTLLAHGRIEDPFFSTNDQTCLWIERKTWVYRTVFDRPNDVETASLMLELDGLDTLAEVFVNGESVAVAGNMFLPVEAELAGKLKEKGNVLVVRFDPVVEYAAKQDVSRFWSKVNYERIWLRKCACNFSWDWSPRIVTAGIWKEVRLKVVHAARLAHLNFKTLSIGPDRAEVEVEAEVRHRRADARLTAETILRGRDGEVRYETDAKDGKISVRFAVEQPSLWWTFDHGEPFLYDLTVNLLADGELVDTLSEEVGIRTIEVRLQSESGSPRFQFVLNGRPIYAKGANWIPAHNFIGAIPDERYEDLVTLSREANMNMLRVWGGGVYEKAAFYRACSRQGLLVWQDFMFSCSEVPDYDEAFMASVRAEIVANVKALRSYPCIAIWAGNNESQAIHSEKMYYRSDTRFYGAKIFHELMPELLAQLDPTRLYWPSSPWGGNDPNSFDEGDTHNWAVWAGDVYPRHYGEASKMDVSPYGISYRRFAEDTSKFSSEFGIHGSTVKETLRRTIPEEELYYGSFEVDYRNKDYEPEKATITMAGYSGLPRDLDEYIDFSMLCQAEGLKFGVEHFRRRMPENGGSLIWQLNDCWPGISWSLIDYYLFPKASYYYARRFYHPLLLSFKEDEGRISVWMTNDSDEAFDDTIAVGVRSCFGQSIYEQSFEVRVAANASMKIVEYAPAEIEWRLGVIDKRSRFMFARSAREDVYDNHFFFAEQKDLRFSPCRLQATKEEGPDGVRVTIETDTFARFVKLECPIDHTMFSDNYFNLLPGERRTVLATNRKGTRIFASDIAVSALNAKQTQRQEVRA
ncbi:beta-mannosidase [Cohnella hashimotonis]|uniref:Beta-mannosidase B n=1 Tax=Cohnella hashimotonis TaxID=2826895 RepID=A0ABT6TR32_9BACL|nr:glycoside hydrolase family 2 protein [Cohnella hashimotonis]MDI4648252.1 glycoside hydrolase family 2 protein [Cohnella hashimotonis]